MATERIKYNNLELINIYINGKPLSDKYIIERFDICITREEGYADRYMTPFYDIILNIKPKETGKTDIPDIAIEDIL